MRGWIEGETFVRLPNLNAHHSTDVVDSGMALDCNATGYTQDMNHNYVLGFNRGL